ncbi:MAG: class F sortase [Actinomycetota bacterium]|nr:class F sortase [Actinomycetota bacterium]
MTKLRRTGTGSAPASVRCGEPPPLPVTETGGGGPRCHTRRGLAGVMLAAAVVLVLGGVALALQPGASSAPLDAPAVVGALPIPVERKPVTVGEIVPEVPPPRAVKIERLGIESALVGLKVQGDGTLEVPADYDQAGWHRGGTAPGDTGPAVVVGHVDSYEGPAVFYRLRELGPGDRVTIERVDGSVVMFEVYGQETVPKDAFPTERVYGPTDGPELRLLTCGGRFDEQARRYNDNVVVYAKQVVEAATS